MRVPKRVLSAGAVAGMAMAAGLGTVATSVSAATTSYPTTLTESAPAALTYGYATRVSGQLTLSQTPFGLAGEQVALYQAPKFTSTWTLVATHGTNYAGRVSFVVAPKSGEQYQLRHAADSYTASSVSPVDTINIRYAVNATLGFSSVTPGAADTITAAVAPFAGSAYVSLQEYVSGSWVTLASKGLNAQSATQFSFHASTTAGTYYYRVYKPGNQSYLAGHNAPIGLTVR